MMNFLKTDSEVDFVYDSYKRIEAIFPKIKDHILDATRKLEVIEQTEYKQAMDQIYYFTSTAKDTIYIEAHNADETAIPLSADSMEKLKYIYDSSRKARRGIELMYDTMRNCSKLKNYADNCLQL